MLGLYNGQRLEEEAEENVVSYSRIGGTAEERTFVRVVLVRGRVQGAILIGDTGTCIHLYNIYNVSLHCIAPLLTVCRFRRDHGKFDPGWS